MNTRFLFERRAAANNPPSSVPTCAKLVGEETATSSPTASASSMTYRNTGTTDSSYPTFLAVLLKSQARAAVVLAKLRRLKPGAVSKNQLVTAK
jgi:hypothetical protein